MRRVRMTLAEPVGQRRDCATPAGAWVLPLVLALGACTPQPQAFEATPPPGDPEPGDACGSDADCASGLVCARTEWCLPAAAVQAIHVSWTISGQPAGSASCTAAPDLQILFGVADGLYDWGYAPVPCVEGKFSIDKMPISYTAVALLREGDGVGGAAGVFDASGNVALDLPY